MQLGMIGLGRMGGNIARRLMRAGHDMVVFDRNQSSVDALAGDTGELDFAFEARPVLAAAPALRNGHSTPWDMQLRHAGRLSSHCAS